MNSSTPLTIEPTQRERRKYRYFPGWTMVGMAAAAQFMSAPGQSYSVAAFKEPMRSSLQISETSFSLAYAFATVISGLLLPQVGRLIDRFGARKMLPIIAGALGFACIGMSQISGLGSLYIGFSFVRSLGQGALSLVAAWMVGEWFSRRRGFATALSGVGGSVSVMVIPLLNAYMIAQFDWTIGWVVLGVMVWIILFIPSLFLVRDRPEDIGLVPDGIDKNVRDPSESDEIVANEKAATTEDSTGDWSVSNVLRDLTFWKLLAVPATSGMVGTGLIFHAVSLLGSRGVSPGWAIALISFQATIATFMAMVAGWLTDRCQARFLLALAMLLLAFCSSLVLVLPLPILAVFYAVAMGIHGSILRSTGMVVWMTYYGRKHQGAIRGIALAAMIFAAAIGPMPLALSIDYFETYNVALVAFIAIPITAGLLVWTVGKPQQQPES